MPLQKLQFRPGINKEGTNYSNEGGWFECDKVRFRSGFPEKLGGWARATATRFYQGVCRALINWVDLGNNNLLGVGTHLKYYINQGRGIYHDVTPLEYSSSPNLSNPFATTTGSRIIVVTDAQYSPAVGDFVTYSGATGFNGVAAGDLNTEFQVTNVVSGTTYQITLPVGVTPSGTGSGGGTAVVARYQLPIGLPAATTGNGFGAGFWNGANLSPYNTTLTYTSGLQSHGDLLNDVSTTINVTDTTNFPASGTILIDAELISYSGKTSTSFTGCVRGYLASNPAYHGTRPGTSNPVYVYNVIGYLGTTGWGDATTGAGVGIEQQLRLWTHDNFGENLLIAPRGGQIYYWINNTSTWPRAVVLSPTSSASYQTDVPIVGTNQVIVSDVSRFVIAMGCNPFGTTSTADFDPMLVRWSDQEDPLTWTPTATTQAGEQRLSNGSYIVQARKTRQEILVWTDSALYSMQYLGPPYIWGFQLLMDNLSIISPNAAITVNNVSYWMGVDKFYSYSGRVETLPCSVWQYIYEDVSFNQQFQIFAGTSEGYNEVWWFYVSNAEVEAATQEQRAPIIDKYVIYNYLERLWYYGSLRRTFWLDSPLQATPLSAVCASVDENATVLDPTRVSVNTGTLLFQESGNDDNSTATSRPIDAYVQSSDFDIGDGHNFGFVWRILPDVNFNGSNQNNPTVTMTVRPRQNSGRPYGFADNPAVVSANNYSVARQYPIQEFTGQVYTRLRGRQMAFKIESNTLGVAWQLGSPRIDIRNDGRR
jgi:hypothetical protein